MKKIHIHPDELKNIPGLLRNILDVAFDEACIMDKDGTILYASESSPMIWGRPNSESIGMKIWDLDDASPYPELLKNGKAIMNRPHVINGIFCITHMIPLFDYDDNIAGAFGTINIRGSEKLKDYLRDAAKLQPSVGKALKEDMKKSFDRISRYTTQYTLFDFLGESAAVKQILSLARKAAQTDYPVLINGETGCGKEIIANGIHAAGPNAEARPFVAVNCAAIPENLLESELFGHTKGAFSGAQSDKIGKFELAGNGTLLLDEIGEMPLAMQSKLLRVLETREFEQIGGNELIPFNARIIASTNIDFREKIKDKSFRADLFYRLSAITITIPPLRARADDIPIIAKHFLRIGDPGKEFSQDALDYMQRYTWLGNVRELRNVITQIIIAEESSVISRKKLEKYIFDGEDVSEQQGDNPVENGFENQGKSYLLRMLKENDYNVSLTAKKIGVSRNTVYYRMNKYGISIRKSQK